MVNTPEIQNKLQKLIGTLIIVTAIKDGTEFLQKGILKEFELWRYLQFRDPIATEGPVLVFWGRSGGIVSIITEVGELVFENLPIKEFDFASLPYAQNAEEAAFAIINPARAAFFGEEHQIIFRR